MQELLTLHVIRTTVGAKQALKRGPWPSIETLRDGGKNCPDIAAHPETRRVIGASQMERVSKDIPGGVNSKGKGTEIRQHGVFSDLEGSCDSLTRQCILRAWFLRPDCSSNGVPEERDYSGLKLSGQSPWRWRVLRWARKEEHIMESGGRGDGYLYANMSAHIHLLHMHLNLKLTFSSTLVSMVTLATYISFNLLFIVSGWGELCEG